MPTFRRHTRRGQPRRASANNQHILGRLGRNWRRFIISATDRPFSNNAPVGQTCTHLPHVVQVSDDPHGSFKSVMTFASMPRPITSQVCAPSISSHTRTQRVHSTQRLWSSTKRGATRPLAAWGTGTGSGRWSHPAWWPDPAARSGRSPRRRRRRGSARRRAAPG